MRKIYLLMIAAFIVFAGSSFTTNEKVELNKVAKSEVAQVPNLMPLLVSQTSLSFDCQNWSQATFSGNTGWAYNEQGLLRQTYQYCRWCGNIGGTSWPYQDCRYTFDFPQGLPPDGY